MRNARSPLDQCGQRRGGYLLAEALVMLVLSVLIGAAMCGALVSQARLARSIAERVSQNDALRAAVHILPFELRALNPSRDVRALSDDSISARWFRGSGTVCRAGAGYVWVRLKGMRLPDASKDSLIVASATDETVVALSDAVPDPSACVGTPGATVYRVRAAPPDTDAGVALLFESGSYYLSQRALRYRLGAEGRQPLTDELLRDAGTALVMRAASGNHPAILRLTLQLRPSLQQQTSRSTSIATPLPNSRLPL